MNPFSKRRTAAPAAEPIVPVVETSSVAELPPDPFPSRVKIPERTALEKVVLAHQEIEDRLRTNADLIAVASEVQAQTKAAPRRGGLLLEAAPAPALAATPAAETAPAKSPERTELEESISHYESLERRLRANADLLSHATEAETTAKAEAATAREKLADAVLAGNGRAVQREMASVRDSAELATSRVFGLTRQKQILEAELIATEKRVGTALLMWKSSEEQILAEQYREICRRFEDELVALLPLANGLNGRLRLALINIDVPFPGETRSIVTVPRSVYLPPDRAALIREAGRIVGQAESRREASRYAEPIGAAEWHEVRA